ncbi:hypothetical protein [Comamonas antarctica]|uniref:Uncharacterized protein n=1 Tax=Comamonas antarctica TaxID=2743470 RepID=A0A6N1WZC7_9BURK|nr:hypothetical protein [Comamonas antarctica]QKV52038.1 hypothetical protein HUK68_03485 [Comamonas antarctica]
MNAKNNAARVAVKAKPCQKQAASPCAASLPTWQQAMVTALSFAQYSLEGLVRTRCADKDWDDRDVDIDMSVDLALLQIKSMRASPPNERSEFETGWYMAAAAINLCVRTFSRPDTGYFRSLDALKKKFEVLAATVEFVDEEERYGS